MSNFVPLPDIPLGLFTALFFAETLESLLGDIYVLLLGLRSLFFETVQDVDDIFNLLQIENAIPSSLVLVPQFVDTLTHCSHRLAVLRHLTSLDLLQGITQISLHRLRELPQNLQRITEPDHVCKPDRLAI